MVYLTVSDGTFVKTDRGSHLDADYVVYTQFKGVGVTNAGSSQMGIIGMASAIEVTWVSDLIPKLKDQVDIERLSSRQ